jgi:hypothetical protein
MLARLQTTTCTQVINYAQQQAQHHDIGPRAPLPVTGFHWKYNLYRLSIAGSLVRSLSYRYSTRAAPARLCAPQASLFLICTSRNHRHGRLLTRLGGALLLEVLVVVVASLCPGDVVAVPAHC